MKLAGFLLLLSGWLIGLTALAILPKPAMQGAFLIAGVGVEIVGVVLLFRDYMYGGSPSGGSISSKEERG